MSQFVRALSTNQFFKILLSLYIASLLMSTAGISIFLWALFIVFIFDFRKEVQTHGFLNTVKSMKSGLEIPLLGIVAWTFISSLVNVGTLQDFLVCMWEMRFALGFYFLTFLFKKHFHGHHRLIFQVTGWVVIFCGLYGLAQMLFKVDIIRSTTDHITPFGNFFRATGFFKIPLTYAYIVGMFAMVMYGYVISQSHTHKNKAYYFALFATLIGLAGVISSWTRGAWIGAYAAIMFVTFLQSRKYALRVFVVSTIGFLVLLVNQDFRHRALSIVDIKDYHSNTERIEVWSANISMMNSHPILGVGWNQNHDPQKLKEHYEKVGIYDPTVFDHAHNDYINIGAKLGYPGFILYLWLVFGFLWKTIQKLKQNAHSHRQIILLGCLGAQVVFYVGSLTQANFTDTEVCHALFTIWALSESQ